MTTGIIVKTACSFVIVALAVACGTRTEEASDQQAGEIVGGQGPARSCAPMDAKGQGACRAIVGTAWNGSACVTLAGCDCVGVDCARATATECQAKANACGAADGGATDANVADVQLSDGGATTICDARRVACRSLPPICPAGQGPSVVVSNLADPDSFGCWGPCVPVETCACSGPNGGNECPKDHACWGHVKHCGPFVR